MIPLTDDELLDGIKTEREKFTRSNEELLRAWVDEAIRRRIYPTHWPAPDVWSRVQGWGAFWHLWTDPLNCPKCNADFCDRVAGPPFKREIGMSSRERDGVFAWRCPDCGHEWPR